MDIQEIIDDFAFFDEWSDRYRHLIDMGRQIPALPEEHKNEINRVQGCQSQVWLLVHTDDTGAIRLQVDSDSAIVKGLTALILALYDGKKPQEIPGVDVEGIFRTLGLDQHLSPNRRNGFFSMVERIKAYGA